MIFPVFLYDDDGPAAGGGADPDGGTTATGTPPAAGDPGGTPPAANPGDGGAPATAPPKPQYDQASFDKGVQTGMAKAAKKAADAAATAAAEKKELETLRAEKAKAAEDKLRQDGKLEELLSKQKAEHEKERRRLEKEAQAAKDLHAKAILDRDVRSAIGRSKVLPAAADQVAALLAGSIKLADDGITTVVVDAQGDPLINAKTGMRFTVDEHISAFLGRNAHFQAAANPNGGAGGTASSGGTPTTPPATGGKTREQLIQEGASAEQIIELGLESDREALMSGKLNRSNSS